MVPKKIFKLVLGMEKIKNKNKKTPYTSTIIYIKMFMSNQLRH